MYLKCSILIITLLFSLESFGQTDTLLAKIFYGLDLGMDFDKLEDTLKYDSKFLKPRSTIFEYGDTEFYYGESGYGGSGFLLVNDGVIETRTDSVKIFTFESNGTISCADCVYDHLIHISINSYSTSLKYYYHSSDSLDKAYNKFLQFLISNGKEIEEITYVNAKPDKKVVFKNSHFVDDKTLNQINGKFQLIRWPELSIKKKISDGIFYLELEFVRVIAR